MTDHEVDELKHRVERAHRATPGAHDPATDIWQRAKHLANPEPTREEVMMNMAPTLSAPTTPLPRLTETRNGFLSRFTSMTATLAIVAILAFGGWFAAMNLPPGSIDNQLAMAPGTPAVAATCDVEPMTIDQVMSIVKDPYAFVVSGDIEDIGTDATGYYEVPFSFRSTATIYNPTALLEPQNSIGEEEFAEAQFHANQFLACLQQGTVAQVLALISPIDVHRFALETHPVLRTEEDIRTTMTDVLTWPGYMAVMGPDGMLADPTMTFMVNPDPNAAFTTTSDVSRDYPITSLMVFGIRVVDANGDIEFENDANNRVNEVGSLKTTDRMRIIMGYSVFVDRWYVSTILFE